jgi:hypothetical protein
MESLLSTGASFSAIIAAVIAILVKQLEAQVRA